MSFIKSHLYIFAALASFFAAGIIIFAFGIASMIKVSKPNDIYNMPYTQYLVDNTAVKGDIWCVEACFAESESYAYALIPAVDKSTFIDDEQLKFVVFCYEKSKSESFEAMAEYWNGNTDTAPENISFEGVISKIDNSNLSQAIYDYFNGQYGFSSNQTDEYYLPYIITEVDSFAYAYVPKLLVGAVFMLMPAAVFAVLYIRFLRKNKAKDLNSD